LCRGDFRGLGGAVEDLAIGLYEKLGFKVRAGVNAAALRRL
jgi:hypothetical protein